MVDEQQPIHDFEVNGRPESVSAPPEMPLLWVLRDLLGLTGTKYGCGIGVCGSCTVHVDRRPARSCLVPVAEVTGRTVTTIEGLGAPGLHEVQEAWLRDGVPQCGYCQPGQIMTAAALFAEVPSPTDAQLDAAMSGNLCRCGTYGRIRATLRSLASGGPQ